MNSANEPPVESIVRASSPTALWPPEPNLSFFLIGEDKFYLTLDGQGSIALPNEGVSAKEHAKDRANTAAELGAELHLLKAAAAAISVPRHIVRHTVHALTSVARGRRGLDGSCTDRRHPSGQSPCCCSPYQSKRRGQFSTLKAKRTST